MSELIENDKARKEQLKSIIESIDSGADVDRAKRKFAGLIKNVSPEEIAELEQSLIADGMPVERVQSLCELHVDAFQDALEKNTSGKPLPGHPIDTYKQENRKAKSIARTVLRAAKRLKRGKDDGSFTKSFESLKQIVIHYQRKENQLFPYLEQVGFTGPSKVMWGKHDEIRELFSRLQSTYVSGRFNDVLSDTRELVGKIRKMIFMEERILFPTALRKLTDDAWSEMRRGEHEIGYSWIAPGNLWDSNVVARTSGSAARAQVADNAATISQDVSAEGDGGARADVADLPIDLHHGSLDSEQIDLMLKSLPVDISFVDESDRVRYYSDTPERVFPWSPGIIGRLVQDCHPPKSVHVVEQILESFKKRERSTADFWLEAKDRFIHIRYFALFDDHDTYRGVIEVSQDVTDIRALEGSKTLLD